jgi:hypothetical protein
MIDGVLPLCRRSLLEICKAKNLCVHLCFSVRILLLWMNPVAKLHTKILTIRYSFLTKRGCCKESHKPREMSQALDCDGMERVRLRALSCADQFRCLR